MQLSEYYFLSGINLNSNSNIDTYKYKVFIVSMRLLFMQMLESYTYFFVYVTDLDYLRMSGLSCVSGAPKSAKHLICG